MTKQAKLPVKIRSADFDSFNFKAPTRCTLVITASALVTGGSNDPNPSNNRVVIEVNVVDKTDVEQTTANAHETPVKSASPTTLTIPAQPVHGHQDADGSGWTTPTTSPWPRTRVTRSR